MVFGEENVIFCVEYMVYIAYKIGKNAAKIPCFAGVGGVCRVAGKDGGREGV
jgi:hypothetical protein